MVKTTNTFIRKYLLIFTGQWLSIEDRQRLRKLVEDFVRLALGKGERRSLCENYSILQLLTWKDSWQNKMKLY